MKHNFMFTSESVTEGHPDKLCDQISDAIVDAFLAADPHSKVVAECAASTGILFLAARFVSQATLDIAEVARRTVHQIGYENDEAIETLRSSCGDRRTDLIRCSKQRSPNCWHLRFRHANS